MRRRRIVQLTVLLALLVPAILALPFINGSGGVGPLISDGAGPLIGQIGRETQLSLIADRLAAFHRLEGRMPADRTEFEAAFPRIRLTERQIDRLGIERRIGDPESFGLAELLAIPAARSAGTRLEIDFEALRDAGPDCEIVVESPPLYDVTRLFGPRLVEPHVQEDFRVDLLRCGRALRVVSGDFVRFEIEF